MSKIVVVQKIDEATAFCFSPEALAFDEVLFITSCKFKIKIEMLIHQPA